MKSFSALLAIALCAGEVAFAASKSQPFSLAVPGFANQVLRSLVSDKCPPLEWLVLSASVLAKIRA